MICELISQSYSFPLKKPFAKTVFVVYAKWYLEAHGGLLWKGKYPQIKTGKELSENLFVFCEIMSPNYSFPLQRPFAKTVLVEFAKGYLEANRGLLWKRKYPQMKTGKKLSEILLCDVRLPLTELHLYIMELFSTLISVEYENWYFGSLWRL